MKEKQEKVRIEVRTTAEKKAQLEELASKRNMGVGSLMVEATLSATGATGRTAELCSGMCDYWKIVSLEKDPSMLTKLTEWGNRMWQCLK